MSSIHHPTSLRIQAKIPVVVYHEDSVLNNLGVLNFHTHDGKSLWGT